MGQSLFLSPSFTDTTGGHFLSRCVGPCVFFEGLDPSISRLLASGDKVSGREKCLCIGRRLEKGILSGIGSCSLEDTCTTA